MKHLNLEQYLSLNRMSVTEMWRYSKDVDPDGKGVVRGTINNAMDISREGGLTMRSVAILIAVSRVYPVRYAGGQLGCLSWESMSDIDLPPEPSQ